MRRHIFQLPRILWISAVLITSCSTNDQSKAGVEAGQKLLVQDTTSYAERFPSQLHKRMVTANGNYYLLTQFSDSTFKITWGNEIMERVYDIPLDFMFAERLNVQWENKDYLILSFWTGNNAWVTIALPLNNKEQAQAFSNGLCFDMANNILVTENTWQSLWQGDTALRALNLKTRQTQFIIEKERPCDSQTCIDTISIGNKLLYYKWTTQSATAQPNSVEKRVRLKL